MSKKKIIKSNQNHESAEKSEVKIKICGMKYADNINELALLKPNYFGFIFFEQSSRFFNAKIPILSSDIKKVGVFVNASLDDIIEKIEIYGLDLVQLHGEETPEFCETLKRRNDHHIKIIKVFSIKDQFDFNELTPYEMVCDYYLFDTKGKLPGGNGYVFNWEALKDYPSTKPYFLSGGIGLEEAENINAFLQLQESQYCHAIDINSKFETRPGLKDSEQLTLFKNKLNSITRSHRFKKP